MTIRCGLVAIEGDNGHGSGTIWSEDGLIVTNHHVVQSESATVHLGDGRSLRGTVVARHPEQDLAILRVDVDGLPALEAGDSATVRIGQLVFAAGNPWGQPGVVTAGIVLGVGGAGPENGVPLPEAIRADVQIAPGNSGGPLADAAGRVLGIISMIAGGQAIAVPSNAVERLLAAARPAAVRGFIGVELSPVTLPDRLAAVAGGSAGLIVTAIDEDGPAWNAGVLPGDIIVGVGDGTGAEAVFDRLRRIEAGAALSLRVLRGGRICEIEALPMARAA